MAKSHIAIRATNEPSIVELEVVVPPTERIQVSLDRLLRRHGAHCLYSYVVSTALRTILRAKVARVGGESMDTVQMVSLLEDIRTNYADNSRVRAA